MNDFQKDINYFIHLIFKRSEHRFVTVETNDKNTQSDVIRRLTERRKTDSVFVIDLSSSSVRNSTNIEELIEYINSEVKKKVFIGNSPQVCVFYFSQEEKYEVSYRIFSLLNLSREYLNQTFLSTIFIFNPTYLSIFIVVAKDVFSWTQYNFTFFIGSNNIPIMLNSIKQRFEYTKEHLEAIQNTEKNYENGIDQLNSAIGLAYYYAYIKHTDTQKYIKYLQKNRSYLENPYIIDFCWSLFYGNTPNARVHIEQLINAKEDIFSIPYFDLRYFVNCLDAVGLSNEKFASLLTTVKKHLIEQNNHTTSYYFESLISLLMHKEINDVLNLLYKYIDAYEHLEDKSLYYYLDSVYLILSIEYNNANYEKIISLYDSVVKNINCIENKKKYADHLSKNLFYFAESFNIKHHNLQAKNLYKDAAYIRLKYKKPSVDIITIYSKLSHIYYLENRTEKAKKYLRKTTNMLDVFLKQEPFENIISEYVQVAAAYYHLNLLHESEIVLNKTIDLLKKHNLPFDTEVINLYLALYFIYYQVNQSIMIERFFNDLENLISLVDKDFNFEDVYHAEAYLQLLALSALEYVNDNKSSEALHMLKNIKSFVNIHKSIYIDIFDILKRINYRSQRLKHSVKIRSIVDHLVLWFEY